MSKARRIDAAERTATMLDLIHLSYAGSNGGALGKAIGQELEAEGHRLIPYVRGVAAASGDDLKALCASLATYGGAALFHLEALTPEAAQLTPPSLTLAITPADLEHVSQNDAFNKLIADSIKPEGLIDQAQFRANLAAAARHYLPRFKNGRWDRLAQLLQEFDH